MRQTFSVVAAFWLFGFAGAIAAQSVPGPYCLATSNSVLDMRLVGSTTIVSGGVAGIYEYDNCLLELGHTPGDPFGVDVDLLVSRPYESSMEIDLDLQYRGIPRDVGVSLLKADGSLDFKQIAILPLASDGIFHGSVKVDNLPDYLQVGGYLTIKLEVIFQLPDTETPPCECELNIEWVDEGE